MLDGRDACSSKTVTPIYNPLNIDPVFDGKEGRSIKKNRNLMTSVKPLREDPDNLEREGE